MMAIRKLQTAIFWVALVVGYITVAWDLASQADELTLSAGNQYDVRIWDERAGGGTLDCVVRIRFMEKGHGQAVQEIPKIDITIRNTGHISWDDGTRICNKGRLLTPWELAQEEARND